MAATLALVAIVPLRQGLRDAAPSAPATTIASVPAPDAPGSTGSAGKPHVTVASAGRTGARDAAGRASEGAPRGPSPAHAETRLATSGGPQADALPSKATGDQMAGTDASTSAQAIAARASLEQLYAESAQLEAVLLVASDERVASGPAAALAGELDDDLAGIDAALAQPGLPTHQRVALWERRVQALRQVTGLQTTQRWLAASGERYDGALVSID